MCRGDFVSKAELWSHLWEKYQVVLVLANSILEKSGKRGNDHNVEDLTCELV